MSLSESIMRENGEVVKLSSIIALHHQSSAQKKCNHEEQEQQAEYGRCAVYFWCSRKCDMDSQDDGVFGHDEADITMISYVL